MDDYDTKQASNSDMNVVRPHEKDSSAVLKLAGQSEQCRDAGMRNDATYLCCCPIQHAQEGLCGEEERKGCVWDLRHGHIFLVRGLQIGLELIWGVCKPSGLHSKPQRELTRALACPNGPKDGSKPQEMGQPAACGRP
eukprot:scaffold178823_cov42-Prasinocladus_malaysianus.AAC.1